MIQLLVEILKVLTELGYTDASVTTIQEINVCHIVVNYTDLLSKEELKTVFKEVLDELDVSYRLIDNKISLEIRLTLRGKVK